MITKIIRASLSNRGLVLLLALILAAAGVYAIKNIPLDALPDVAPVEVIIHASYPGQSPQVVDDQVTYPLSTAMLRYRKVSTCAAFPTSVTRSCT